MYRKLSRRQQFDLETLQGGFLLRLEHYCIASRARALLLLAEGIASTSVSWWVVWGITDTSPTLLDADLFSFHLVESLAVRSVTFGIPRKAEKLLEADLVTFDAIL